MKKISFILLLLTIPVFARLILEWKHNNELTNQTAVDSANDSDAPPDPLIQGKDTKRKKSNDLSEDNQREVTSVGSNRGADVSSNHKLLDFEVVPDGNRYALLIGVNRYVRPIKSLQFCVNDMELLAECFQKSGIPRENIILVTDNAPFDRSPTGGNICRQIESITSLMEPDDQLIIAFSGHGAMVDGKSYLCPGDTDLKNKNSIVSRDWAFEQLEKCKAKQKVFIIDACRNEIAMDGGKAVGSAKTLDDPIGSGTHGFILIASCDKKQQSWENSDLRHSVFTYFLAQGLSGAARNEEGYVTIMSLFQYASSKTKMFVFHNLNEVQVPTFRQGGEMTDFCLAKVENIPIVPTLSAKQMLSLNTPGMIAGEKRILTVNGIDFAFRWCPPGTFMMGSPETEKGRYNNETQHQVTLTKGFWILETEVTFGMFKAFAEETGYVSVGNPPFGNVDDKWMPDSRFSWRNPGFSSEDNHPVTCVSWHDAVEFCKWLSEKTRLNITLPTEAQWEYACRAGTPGAFAGNLDEIAWHSIHGYQPVGTKKPNAWGLYDMHANIMEWCADWYGEYPSGSVTDPAGPSDGSNRIFRGGCCGRFVWACRSASRDSTVPENCGADLGFRVLTVQ